MSLRKISLLCISVLCAALFCVIMCATPTYAGLSCSIVASSSCSSPSVVILRMASSTNAHAEMPNQSNANYSNNVICCGGVTGLSNSCTNTSVAIVVHLASTTNSHVEESTFSNFSNNACMSVASGTILVGYQSTNCSGYDTSLASLAKTSNSHIGSPTSYPTNIICARYVSPESISFSLSTTTVGFGNLSAATTIYATSNLLGSTTLTVAHTFSVLSSASSGYSVLIQGAPLTSGSSTITAIGGTNTPSATGTLQFGMNLSASGGTGAVSSPYSGSGYAYAATATTTSQVASEPVGDSTNTTYSVTYVANIAASSPGASYSTAVTYLVTANF